MGYLISYFDQLVHVTEPQTDINMQDLYDWIEDQQSMPVGLNYDDIIGKAEGKAELKVGEIYTGITIRFASPWQLRFWDGSYVARIDGGNLVGGLNGKPIAYTPDVQVIVIQSAAATIVSTGGSALTQTEHDKLMTGLDVSIPDNTWDTRVDEHTELGTFGGEVATKDDLAASASTIQVYAAAASIIQGSDESGSFLSTHVRDNVYWILGETSGGLTAQLDFRLTGQNTRPGSVSVFGRYIGTPPNTHYMGLYAYNFEALAFEKIREVFMPGGNTSDALYTAHYNERHIDRESDNLVRIQLVHAETTYNQNHRLYLDYIEVSGVEIVTAEDIAMAVWDRELRGNTHNIPTSAGRRLREVAGAVVTTGIALGNGNGYNQIELNGDASEDDGAYDPATIAIVNGTGYGQIRGILEYKGEGKIATVDRNWKVQPDVTTEYVVYAWPGREHVNEGLALGGTATTITLNALASSYDDAYKGQIVFIRSGLAEDQTRLVVGYEGTTHVATVNEPWSVIPDTIDAYVMLPAHIDVNGSTLTEEEHDKLMTGLDVEEAQLNVAYSEEITEIRMDVWLDRNGQTVPQNRVISCEVRWYSSSGLLMFTSIGSAPDFAGRFRLVREEELVSSEAYSAVVMVTDDLGTVETNQAVTTAG